MLNYGWTEEQSMIRELARKVALDRIKPHSREWDEKGEFPWEAIKALAQADFFRVCIPEQYGGMGGGVTSLCLVTEELSRIDGGVATTYAASFLGALPILLFGTEEQKQKYLPQFTAGEKIAAFAVTEPAAGSDVAALKTRADKNGEAYLLNGVKHFITNGGDAELYVIVAMTDKTKGSRGASAFIVEKGDPGFTFGKKEEKMGIRASSTRELIFQDCRIPKDRLLGGREGMGFIAAVRTFDYSRPGVAAQAVGIAQGALDLALAYAHQREQFGQKLTAFQGIQWMLADMGTKVEAARALVYTVARSIDRGDKDFSAASAMAKLYAGDVAMEVATQAVQIYGGYGYMRDYPIEKFMRDAKITQIYEGTAQIQRNVIALQMIKELAK